MTRKDYVALAGAIRANKAEAPELGDGQEAAWAQHALFCRIAQSVADACAENPRFDRNRFLIACGVSR